MMSVTVSFARAAAACLVTLSIGVLLATVPIEAATILTAERVNSPQDASGAVWAGFLNGVPDLSSSDYLEGLAHPFTAVSGSMILSGASAPLSDAGLAYLNNGTGSTTNNQTIILGNAAYVRLLIDLQPGAGNSVFVEEFNSYGMVMSDSKRNYQVFDLYGSNAVVAPGTSGDPASSGWTLIASVNQAFSNATYRTNGVHIDDIDQSYRYLLFHATASDVFNPTSYGNHYVELDVVGYVVPEPSACTLLGIAALSLMSYGWRRRRS